MTTTPQQKRKFLLILPVLVIPFLFIAFYSLGGGKDKLGSTLKKGTETGFNTELPPVLFDDNEGKMNKLDYYKRADLDSIRRKEQMQQDPYRRGDGKLTSRLPGMAVPDTQPDYLLKKLDLLQRKLEEPKITKPTVHQAVEKHADRWEDIIPAPAGKVQVRDNPVADPELEKLDSMLDKIARIQQPKREEAVMSAVELFAETDTVINSLPAVVQEDQLLVAGGTIALRLTEAVRINGVLFSKDQPAYGVVSINNDRMLITVHSIRREQSIYPTALQAYDLDGLPGIHIPGSLGRETAKQSLDQSISSMNIAPFDASPAAQVTNAGVQAAKSLLSRKARQVRVAVKAGYQVLLKSTKTPAKVQLPGSIIHPTSDSILAIPDPGMFTPFLHKRVKHERMILTLQAIYLHDSLLWLRFLLENHSPIGYKPDYIRWCIRDRHEQRRTAIQELPLKPVYSSPPEVLPGDSSRIMLAAFQPFSLPGDKELVVQMAEGNGARELGIKIRQHQLLKVRRYEPQ